jgi:SAM-dependent methyltransferase
MAQYQTFPDATGASRTLEKLRALMLPDLTGRDFLDVGCNEGFFCGFAKFMGARRVVGVDHSELFIERARQRFPNCEFLQQGWLDLPAGPFDVILLASALHYAEDQPGLLHSLVERLSADGVLVLELGIASAPDSAWVRVKRGIDERDFPTMSKLREVLRGYAWKWMGRSVSQDGDPVARHVVHISRRRPLAYLLMQPPGYGKSSIAAGLFLPANVHVVSGDQQVAELAAGRLPASAKLREVAARGYSPFTIDETIRRLFTAGLCPELAQLWVREAAGKDFALDMYVPPEHYAEVAQTLAAQGYLPVQLQWERVGPTPLAADLIQERAGAFYKKLGMAEAPKPQSDQSLLTSGYVDELSVEQGRLTVRGWAVDASGALPERLEVRALGQQVVLEAFEKQLRPDVQRHLKLPHALLGYRATFELPGVAALHDLAGGFEMSVPGAGRVRLARKVAKLIGGTR